MMNPSPATASASATASSGAAAAAVAAQQLQLQQLPFANNNGSIALTRNQYALECGGVLLDPSTNEVCLLFYPDTSEWRLPIGRPDTMAACNNNPDASYHPAEPSVSGCEPPAHSAQRLITQITGYRCTHLHPTVLSQCAHPCAYIGPQMVEPLALHIEQRTASSSHSTNGGGGAGSASSSPDLALDDLPIADDVSHHPRLSPACQYVLTCYYMAWLTQSRFEQRAATLPVGPAAAASSSSSEPLATNATTNGQQMPLAEVTWFKMDTAAQVLTHASDKLALREAIHRLARSDMPRAPFAYATTTTTITAAATTATILPDFTAVDALQEPAILADEAMGASSDAGSSAESSAGFSDAATKTGTTNEMRVVSPAAGATRNNLDLLRKTATSLSKRGGLLIRSGRSSSGNKEEDGGEARKNAVPPPTASMPLVITQPAIAAQGARPASTPQELVVRTKPHIPRVLSIFYKLVGSSSS